MNRDKVINTRVSQKLYDRIFTKAKKNRVTISNFIRNLVEDTIEIHEDFHDAIDKKVKSLLKESDNPQILGYQEITLAKDAVCEFCGATIKMSEKAYFAIFDNDEVKRVMCPACKSSTKNVPKEKVHADTSDR